MFNLTEFLYKPLLSSLRHLLNQPRLNQALSTFFSWLVTKFRHFPLASNLLESGSHFVFDHLFRPTHPPILAREPKYHKPPSFAHILFETRTKLQIRSPSWTLSCRYHQDNRITRIYPPSFYNQSKPSFIYHHGAGEEDPSFSFNLIFGPQFSQTYNLFLIQAQKHHSRQQSLDHMADTFIHQQQAIAGSVLALDAIIQYHRSRSNQPVIAVGYSLGGIIVSHHAYYFGSADTYFPLTAYPNVGEIIFTSPFFRTHTKNWIQKRQQPAYLKSYQIKRYPQKTAAKTFPVLGKIDRLIPYPQANRFWQNQGITPLTYPHGHLAPILKAQALRTYVNQKTHHLLS